MGQILVHLHGWGWLQLYPFKVDSVRLVFTVFMVVLFSVFYLLYWGSEKVDLWRQHWVECLQKYLIVGGVDCFFSIFPYIGYLFALVVLGV